MQLRRRTHGLQILGDLHFHRCRQLLVHVDGRLSNEYYNPKPKRKNENKKSRRAEHPMHDELAQAYVIVDSLRDLPRPTMDTQQLQGSTMYKDVV